jgi:hypothetical protein
LFAYSSSVHAGSYSGAIADQGQNQSISNSFNSSDPIRQMPYPTAPPVNMRGGPSYFAGPSVDMGRQFIPASQLVSILNAVDTTHEFIGDDEDDEISVSVTVLAHKKVNACKAVKFEIINENTSYKLHSPVAVGVVSTNEEQVTSATLAAKLCQIAKDLGASKVIILREGIVAQLQSSGWGIGLSNSINVVNASPTGIGGFAASGTGYSTGTAYYIKLPYIGVAFVE